MKYTVEYCKNNKVAILINAEEEYKKVRSYAINTEIGYENMPDWQKVYLRFDNTGYCIVQSGWWSETSQYEIITAQQFIQDNMQNSNKNLIGYKLKEDCKQYEEAASQICGYKLGKLDTIANGTSFLTNSRDKQNLEKAGVLDLWFEPVYIQDELKVGQWVIVENPCKTSYNKKNSIDKITSSMQGTLIGFPEESLIYCIGTGYYEHASGIRKLTQQEIQNHLISLAKEKGFVDGAKYDTGDGFAWTISKIDWKYNSINDTLLVNIYKQPIYENGKWATIIPQKEVVKMSCSNNRDIEVEITTDGIKYDGTALSIKVIQEILNFTTKVNGWAVVPEMFSIGCREGIDRGDLQKVLDVYNKLNK